MYLRLGHAYHSKLLARLEPDRLEFVLILFSEIQWPVSGKSRLDGSSIRVLL